MIRPACLLLGLAAALPADAQTLSFPGNATLTAESSVADQTMAVPIGPFADGALPSVDREGRLAKQAWRIPSPGLTPLQLLRPLRSQLRDQGFDVVFDCETDACGGFDFRFAVELLPPPDMQVDIGQFHALSALRDDAAVFILASTVAGAGYVHVTTIGDATVVADVRADAAPVRSQAVASDAADIDTALATAGRSVLQGIAFESGSATLAEGGDAALAALADYLSRYPARTVALVGHTDASGSLEANVSLSRRRAAAVLERLVSEFGADRGQLEAQGMGYLAPLSSNLTEDGRATNRRVEVIVTSTD